MDTEKITKIKDAIEWANKRISLQDLSQGFTPLQWEYLEFAFQDFIHKSSIIQPVNEGGMSLKDMEKEVVEILDENLSVEGDVICNRFGTALKIIDLFQSKAVKEEGREVEFAEWLLENEYNQVYENQFFYKKRGGDEAFTSSELFQIFLKQNPKP